MKYLLSKKSDFYGNYDSDKQKVVVALAADYGNLGDVAIAYAQTKFLEIHFPQADIIDFPISKTFTHMKSLKSVIKPNDTITIVGGGNTGDMYDDIEFARQFVISQFPDNKIICFPQTIDFSETQYGRKALKKAIKVYGRHKNLTLSAREERSFKVFEKLFNANKIVFVPDIVLSLDESQPNFKREGITLCFRADGEKKMSNEIQERLISQIGLHNTIRFQDTHIDKKRMSLEEREKELDTIWTAFKKSELVITDRLHGMIFCAITSTPCIAIDNSNKKVSGVFKAWLDESKGIRIAENIDFDVLLDAINNYPSLEVNLDSNANNMKIFERLIE